MATLPPDENMPIPEAQGDEPQGNPWESWQGAGIDPSYDPHQARQALGFWDALRNRDQRDYALEQLVRNDLPDGMSWREAQEILRGQQEPQETPWDQFGQQEEPEYEEQQYMPQQQPQFDPRQFQQAVDFTVDQKIAAYEQQRQQEAQQAAFEQEFQREAQRVSGQYKMGDEETVWLAAQANMMRQNMPYASTSEVMDQAGKQIDGVLKARLQAMTQQQQETPAAPMPPGSTPSDQQVPDSAESLREAGRRFFSN